MKHSLVWMMTALTLIASNALAYNNPHILEVDLSIEGVNDSQEFWEPDPPEGAGSPKGPGGFVCSNGFKKITLRAEGVNPPMRMRLNWDSAKIAVCATTNDAGTPGSSEIYWDIQSPWTTQLWVKGVAVSDTGPTKDASGAWMSCGPEHLCLEAINNGTGYVTPLFDRIAFTRPSGQT